jgi:hypothetical protein
MIPLKTYQVVRNKERELVNMGIKVSGSITLRGNFEVELDMTEEKFDALSERKQNEAIENAMDWRNWLDSTDQLDDVDVYDVKETKEEDTEGAGE